MDIKNILKHEGGFVNHPKDPGGATNRGITLNTYKRLINPKGTVEDLKALTEDQAIQIYKSEYWDKVRADDLPKGVGYAVADFAVHSGVSRASKYLQKIVGAKQDGVIGKETIRKTENTKRVIQKLCGARLEFLKSLDIWETFGKGWARRVKEVEQEALK